MIKAFFHLAALRSILRGMALGLAVSTAAMFLGAQHAPLEGQGKNYPITDTPNTTASSPPSSPSGDVALPQPHKAWTVLVYLDADNDLDGFDMVNVDQMKQVGSDSNLNIVLLWDKTDNTHGYYYVQPGSSTLLQDTGEVDMGSVGTAKNFIDYAATNFPADKTMFVYWNHGGAVDRSRKRGVCWDDGTGHHLSEVDQKDIMTYAVSRFGKKFEVVGFDACLMATAEIYYQYRDIANYMAASEQTEPDAGWDYNALQTIKNDPSVNGDAVVKSICTKYAAAQGDTLDWTFSAINLAYAAQLGKAINDFTIAAMNAGVSGSTYASLASGLPSFSRYTKDLEAFMLAVSTSSSFPQIVKDQANTVINLINNSLVLQNQVSSDWANKAYGCSITMKSDTPIYSLLDICVDTQWNEFCTFADFEPRLIKVFPASATVFAGTSCQFWIFSSGFINPAVTWSVDNPSVGTITPYGTFTSVNVGACTVRATSVEDSTKFAEATVTVIPKPVVSVSISPLTATVQAGFTQQFKAYVTGTNKPTLIWAITRGPIGQGVIDQEGRFYALTEGTYHVRATSVVDKTAFAEAIVTVLPASSEITVSIDPSTASIQGGSTTLFKSSVTGTLDTEVIWAVFPPSWMSGTIDSTVQNGEHVGVYYASFNAGTYTIRATSKTDRTKFAEANVTVLPVPNNMLVDAQASKPVVASGETIEIYVTVTIDDANRIDNIYCEEEGKPSRRNNLDTSVAGRHRGSTSESDSERERALRAIGGGAAENNLNCTGYFGAASNNVQPNAPRMRQEDSVKRTLGPISISHSTTIVVVVSADGGNTIIRTPVSVTCINRDLICVSQRRRS